MDYVEDKKILIVIWKEYSTNLETKNLVALKPRALWCIFSHVHTSYNYS